MADTRRNKQAKRNAGAGQGEPPVFDKDEAAGTGPEESRAAEVEIPPAKGRRRAAPASAEGKSAGVRRQPASTGSRDAAAAGPAAGQTSEPLRADIDSGRTHDMVAKSDPAAAPRGSDAEAGGAPPTAAEVAVARRHETGRRTAEKPSASRVAVQTTNRSGWWFSMVVAGVIVVAIILAFVF